MDLVWKYEKKFVVFYIELLEVDTVPVSGGTPKPFLTKFAAPVVLTNVLSDGNLYAGDLTGFVYRVGLGS